MALRSTRRALIKASFGSCSSKSRHASASSSDLPRKSAFQISIQRGEKLEGRKINGLGSWGWEREKEDEEWRERKERVHVTYWIKNNWIVTELLEHNLNLNCFSKSIYKTELFQIPIQKIKLFFLRNMFSILHFFCFGFGFNFVYL